ncbi:hypothetical protein [Phytoactinopolyspora mesophila]|uniref:Uncharacterized protein n=1 Tax=Phytoactinopolyspora mesophila TaxID=2650750 RepID=A0A7K3M3R0_9ACTN|nr:hypothetical protein [Phytoactinopolyspora mesophila]NDL57850.1 hypothetical protein [Phytoactinopolyspora mesophila]
MTGMVVCAAGHQMPAGPDRVCFTCRRDEVIACARAVETSLSGDDVAAAVDTVATNPAVWRFLAEAFARDPDALAHAAPPVVGRLVTELIARGSTVMTVPTCVTCGVSGRPLTVTDDGGMCKRCAARRNPAACSHCGIVKPVAGRTNSGGPICEPCRRHQRGHRPCGVCGNTTSIAVRARGDQPDICVNCYRRPEATCHVCRRRRPCSFADTDRPICASCSPRATAICARCGAHRPPAARWDEGPICDTCYTAALRHRGRCAVCGDQRRLVAPPGPEATTCADCAGVPVVHACIDCGLEDKLYEKDRCARCSLRRRATELLSGASGQVPAELNGVLEAICAARTPRAALNWLRQGAAAAVLTELVSGQLQLTHEALDAHPHPKAADYLRHMLVASGALEPRDEALARTERWLTDLLATIDDNEYRRLVQAFAAWQVMRRLRRHAETRPAPRTYTAHAKLRIKVATEFLTWLTAHDTTLAEARQTDIDQWLATSPRACHVRDFLTWATERRHCPAFTIPAPQRFTGTATDSDQRWAHLARLLHDDELALVDRVAGCFLLLFAQPQSRIAVMTTDQITQHDNEVFVRFGQHDVPVPEPLDTLLLQLIANGKSYTGIGSPADTQWLFPGGMPGRPITASRLAERLRAVGISTQAGRRATLIDLAAKLPAAVLADLLGLHRATAVKWTGQAGGGWNRYAAEIARTR